MDLDDLGPVAKKKRMCDDCGHIFVAGEKYKSFDGDFCLDCWDKMVVRLRSDGWETMPWE